MPGGCCEVLYTKVHPLTRVVISESSRLSGSDEGDMASVLFST